MSAHECHCYACRPDAFPPVPNGPPDARYVAAGGNVGWRRAVPAWAVQATPRACYVTVNGERVPAAYEALTGVVGWVVARRGRTYPHGHGTSHKCPCGSGSDCLEVLWGNVEAHQGRDAGYRP